MGIQDMDRRHVPIVLTLITLSMLLGVAVLVFSLIAGAISPLRLAFNVLLIAATAALLVLVLRRRPR
jgi:hypothetical protein